MQNPHGTDLSSTTNRRLTGWKEISSYFGRSVRTVQRWEREFGLPIRRRGLSRAEVVYAMTDDLARWQATAEAQAAASTAQQNYPTRSRMRLFLSRRKWQVAGLATVTALIGIATLPYADLIGTTPEPSNWRIDGDTITVLDEHASRLWAHRFPFALDSTDASGKENGGWKLAIRDFDGDGHRELVMVSLPADRRKSHWRFYCFSYTGELRWSQGDVPARTFGAQTFEPPYPADRFFLSTIEAGPPALFLVYVHSPWFPSVVYRVDAAGKRLSEFWSSGYITAVRTADWAGRRVTLIGSRNNESGGAAIALLDGWNPSGSAPAEILRYQCQNCPPGQPVRFIELPRPAVLATAGGSSPVLRIECDNPRSILAWVDHFADFIVRDKVDAPTDAIYTFDSQLRPLSVQVADGFALALSVLARAGKIPDATLATVVDELRTVRWWDGSKFVELKAPPASAPPPNILGRK